MMRLIPKLTLFLLTCAYAANAETISADYDVSFSVFGKIGEARVFKEEEAQRYHIHVEGGLTGLAADIGRNRREIHNSYGTVVDGTYLPDRYVKIRTSDNREETTVYTFDHAGRTITKRRTKIRRYMESRFDVPTMSFVDTPAVSENVSEELLPYYARDDLLSLFFNVRGYLADIPRGKDEVRYSAGAGNDEGKIRITNPAGEKRRELASLMPDNEDRLVTVVIDQDIFESDKGELYINLDADYLAIEAMLKDVLLFGDIRAKRVAR